MYKFRMLTPWCDDAGDSSVWKMLQGLCRFRPRTMWNLKNQIARTTPGPESDLPHWPGTLFSKPPRDVHVCSSVLVHTPASVDLWSAVLDGLSM